MSIFRRTNIERFDDSILRSSISSAEGSRTEDTWNEVEIDKVSNSKVVMSGWKFKTLAAGWTAIEIGHRLLCSRREEFLGRRTEASHLDLLSFWIRIDKNTFFYLIFDYSVGPRTCIACCPRYFPRCCMRCISHSALKSRHILWPGKFATHCNTWVHLKYLDLFIWKRDRKEDANKHTNVIIFWRTSAWLRICFCGSRCTNHAKVEDVQHEWFHSLPTLWIHRSRGRKASRF